MIETREQLKEWVEDKTLEFRRQVPREFWTDCFVAASAIRGPTPKWRLWLRDLGMWLFDLSQIGEEDFT